MKWQGSEVRLTLKGKKMNHTDKGLYSDSRDHSERARGGERVREALAPRMVNLGDPIEGSR